MSARYFSLEDFEKLQITCDGLDCLWRPCQEQGWCKLRIPLTKRQQQRKADNKGTKTGPKISFQSIETSLTTQTMHCDPHVVCTVGTFRNLFTLHLMLWFELMFLMHWPRLQQEIQEACACNKTTASGKTRGRSAERASTLFFVCCHIPPANKYHGHYKGDNQLSPRFHFGR